MKITSILITLFLFFNSSLASEENHAEHPHEEHDNLVLEKVEGSHEDHGHDSHDDHSDNEDSHEDHGHDSHDDHSDNEDSHKGHADHEEHGEHNEEGDEHEHGHGTSKAIGKGKAIEDVSEVKGLKLSTEALRTLKLQFKKVSGNKVKIPKGALVVSLEKKGIYRYRDGFFKFLVAIIESEDSDSYTVFSKKLVEGDDIVTEGVGLLRVADIYSTDTSEYGHSH